MSATNASNELTAMIDKLVTEKTFTMDALEAIQATRSKAEQLEAQNEKLTKELASVQTRNSALSSDLVEAQSEVRQWKDRESSIVARESKAFENEKKAAVSEAVASAYLTSMRIVFAPNTVRESVQRYGSVANNGMSIPTSDGGTVLRAEGYSQPGEGGTMHGGVKDTL